jgi:hypothetical protein
MGLVLLEGLDRTGKSTVAAYFETLGFEVIHLSAPPKGTSSDEYLNDMVVLLSQAANKDIVLDRTHYGELIWPQVYSTPQKPRVPLLDEDQIEALREIEESVGVQRLWMTDNNIEAHWKRCVDNKEPLDKSQFTRARALYSTMAHKYKFEPVTLQSFIKKFPDAQLIVDKEKAEELANQTLNVTVTNDQVTVVDANQPAISTTHAKYPTKTKEQHTLEVANVVNDILSKRILKGKGDVYDGLEAELRNFLNNKLGKLLGHAPTELSLTPEEIKFYKAMYKRANDKGVQ